MSRKIGEESVARRVRDVLQGMPSVTDSLKLGVVNYSALSRMISEELDVKNGEAVVSAIKRYHEGVDGLQRDKVLRKLAAESTLELRPDVAIVNISKESDWRKFANQMRVHHVVEGPSYTNIVVDERSLPPSLSEGAVARRGLAVITIKRPKEATVVPGVVVYFLTPLATSGINIVELMTCGPDNILVLKLEDAQKSFSILNELIRESRNALARASSKAV